MDLFGLTFNLTNILMITVASVIVFADCDSHYENAVHPSRKSPELHGMDC